MEIRKPQRTRQYFECNTAMKKIFKYFINSCFVKAMYLFYKQKL